MAEAKKKRLCSISSLSKSSRSFTFCLLHQDDHGSERRQPSCISCIRNYNFERSTSRDALEIVSTHIRLSNCRGGHRRLIYVPKIPVVFDIQTGTLECITQSVTALRSMKATSVVIYTTNTSSASTQVPHIRLPSPHLACIWRPGIDMTSVVLFSDNIHSKDWPINAHILAVASSREAGITVSVRGEMIKGNNGMLLLIYIHAMHLLLH